MTFYHTLTATGRQPKGPITNTQTQSYQLSSAVVTGTIRACQY